MPRLGYALRGLVRRRLHNLSMAEGNPVWRYEPGHPMTVVFTTTVEPGDLADTTLCEQVFMLLDIGPTTRPTSNGPRSPTRGRAPTAGTETADR